MPLIDWKEEFALGIPAVDHEHRELIALINEAHAERRRDGAPEAIAAFLGEIHARISAHFALEEKVMRERRYDRYTEHKRDHERLLDGIRDIMDAYEDGTLFEETEFARTLESWFVTHFATHDARLHRHLG